MYIMFVLYLINVIAAESIGPIIVETTHMTLGKVYGKLNLNNFTLKNVIFVIFKNA